MKKWICLALVALMMSLAAMPAIAETVTLEETSPFFDLTLDVPQGLTMKEEEHGDICVVLLEGTEKPELTYWLTVAFDDQYSGKDTQDLTQEELERLFADSLGEVNYDEGSYSVVALDNMKALDIRAKDHRYVNLIAVKDGYFLQVFGMYDDYAQPMDDADYKLGLAILDGVGITQISDAPVPDVTEMPEK